MKEKRWFGDICSPSTWKRNGNKKKTYVTKKGVEIKYCPEKVKEVRNKMKKEYLLVKHYRLKDLIFNAKVLIIHI